MASAVYASYADVLTHSQRKEDDLDALLDPATGFAPRLRKLCQVQMSELLRSDPEANPENLQLEADTWALIQVLMAQRKTTTDLGPSPEEILLRNSYAPPQSLIAATHSRSRVLSELVALREWLHETAPPPLSADAATGYRRFTHARLAQAKRMAGLGGSITADGGLVRSLDPDAAVREEKSLASEDTIYEKNLTNALFACVRAGKLDEAIEITHKAHQPWRAPNLKGAKLFSWNSFDLSQDAAAMTVDHEGWQGNRRRNLWKTSCQRAALNTALPEYERSLFAALAPSPETHNVLSLRCRTWYDHAWATIITLCETRLEVVLDTNRGEYFWEKLELPNDDDQGRRIADNSEAEQEWESEVASMLTGLGKKPVADGPPADDPFHVAQLGLMMDTTPETLHSFAIAVKSVDTNIPDFPQMCRFFAHLCLFMQMIEEPVDPEDVQVILEAYLHVLEVAGQRELIALYAGALGANAIERYASFLASLGLSADPTERRTALARARTHGLDVPAVARKTAGLTLARALEELPLPEEPLPRIMDGAAAGRPSPNEELLVRSLEWTTFSDDTHTYAADQAAVILRYFLGIGKPDIAGRVHESLPRELGAAAEEESALELTAYRDLFAARSALARIGECAALSAQEMARETRAAWLRDYKGLVDMAHSGILKMLKEEWLVEDVTASDRGERHRDLVRIRRIYIPDLILRLHDALVEARYQIPDALRHAFMLSTVVADSRYTLYDDFGPNRAQRLSVYLGKVREAILTGLQDRGGSDPFRPLDP